MEILKEAKILGSNVMGGSFFEYVFLWQCICEKNLYLAIINLDVKFVFVSECDNEPIFYFIKLMYTRLYVYSVLTNLTRF